MKKRFLFSLFLILILIANISLATYNTVTMSVVEEPVCTITIGDNSKFEKKLISKDLSNKEVTLQLQVTNEEASSQPTGELMLVIDNSKSMEDTVSVDGTSKTREDLVINSAKTLVNSILKDNKNLKIGAVSFSTNSDVSKEGTTEDAALVSELSSDVAALDNAISNIQYTGPRTDLDAGLKLASKHFSSESNNKYMIILTDGVPNVAVDYDKNYYSDDVITKTKTQLQSLKTAGYNVITMLTGISNPTSQPGMGAGTKTYDDIIKEVFGTQDAPTVGKFHYVQDSEIERTITQDIYKDLLPVSKTLKNITVTDYFPKEIVDNFEFAYVSKANIGDISAEINTENNSITWTIPELKSGETATVQYKLKLKQNFDSNIVDKILNTNEKVDLKYTDFNDAEVSKTSDVSPKLKLTEPPAVLPKAGSPIIVTLVSLSVGLVLFFFIRFISTNNMMKN
ncbi:MAG: vWA domain-containing protein [Clostridia bacterium]